MIVIPINSIEVKGRKSEMVSFYELERKTETIKLFTSVQVALIIIEKKRENIEIARDW